MTTLEKVRVAPSASFNITDWTIDIIFIVVIGGIGSLEGPIIGAVVFFVLREWLAGFSAWNLIILGVISIAVILFEPRGVWGACRRRGIPDLLPVSYGPVGAEPCALVEIGFLPIGGNQNKLPDVGSRPAP